jgi:putative membrane protein
LLDSGGGERTVSAAKLGDGVQRSSCGGMRGQSSCGGGNPVGTHLVVRRPYHNVYLHQAGHQHWGLLIALFLLLLALVILVIGALLVAGRGPSLSRSEPDERRLATSPPWSAEQILAERLARGEIDTQDYRQRLDTLRD